MLEGKYVFLIFCRCFCCTLMWFCSKRSTSSPFMCVNKQSGALLAEVTKLWSKSNGHSSRKICIWEKNNGAVEVVHELKGTRTFLKSWIPLERTWRVLCGLLPAHKQSSFIIKAQTDDYRKWFLRSQLATHTDITPLNQFMEFVIKILYKS